MRERIESKRLTALALLFTKLGCIAFGGPAAHLGLMENEVVHRRRWLSRPEFLDLVGATNLIPGPNSTELALHIGYRRGGWPGLLIAGTCFIVPAALLTLAFAWAYVRFGALPPVQGILYGIKPVVLAVVIQALWRLARSALKSVLLGALAVLATAASLLGAHEVAILAAAGVAAMLARRIRPRARSSSLNAILAASGAVVAGGSAATSGTAAGGAAAVTFGLLPLFLFFLKVGAVLFGSGYVLLAFLRADLVQRWHWLTESQLLDAVAVGQITPGPMFSTATFIGYVLGGGPGAALATIGIFLPAFVFVAASVQVVPRLRRSVRAAAFLDGVIAASLALMATVTAHLARAAVVDVPAGLLAAASAFLLLRFRLGSAWLVLAGASLGMVRAWLR